MNNACVCSLPALTGSTKCCDHCNNNPNRTFQASQSSDIIPTQFLMILRTCRKCGCCFQSDIANYCPNCGEKIDEEME